MRSVLWCYALFHSHGRVKSRAQSAKKLTVSKQTELIGIFWPNAYPSHDRLLAFSGMDSAKDAPVPSNRKSLFCVKNFPEILCVRTSSASINFG